MKIEVMTTPDSADLKTISQGLQAHNAKFIGPAATDDELMVAVFARNDTGEVIGGIRALAMWDWLNIEVIWVAEEARGMGVGSQLLAKAESFAVENRIYAANLETTSFQARDFYEKQGYEIFGKLENFPRGHTMFYMKKVLTN
jgi:ribosomal protein S18 acetylase RimI-like enzyme